MVHGSWFTVNGSSLTAYSITVLKNHFCLTALQSYSLQFPKTIFALQRYRLQITVFENDFLRYSVTDYRLQFLKSKNLAWLLLLSLQGNLKYSTEKKHLASLLKQGALRKMAVFLSLFIHIACCINVR